MLQLVIIGIYTILTVIFSFLKGYTEVLAVVSLIILMITKSKDTELYKTANYMTIICSMAWAYISESYLTMTVLAVYAASNIILNFKIEEKDIKFCNVCNIIALIITVIIITLFCIWTGYTDYKEIIAFAIHLVITIVTIETIVVAIGTRIIKIENIIIINVALLIIAIIDKSIIYSVINFVSLASFIYSYMKNEKMRKILVEK